MSEQLDVELREAAQRRSQALLQSDGQGRSAMPSDVGKKRSRRWPVELSVDRVQVKGEDKFHVVGHASVVETPYVMWDVFGEYREIIDRKAFDVTLANDPDVSFLVNHRGVTMARTANGTLKLSMDDVGLLAEAWLNPKRPDVQILKHAIEDKDVDEMSFAFMLDAGEWSEDFTEFRITQTDLDRGDVSAVNYGANPTTDIAGRSSEVIAELDYLPAGAARVAIVRLQARADLAPKISASEEKRGRSIDLVETMLELEDDD